MLIHYAVIRLLHVNDKYPIMRGQSSGSSQLLELDFKKNREEHQKHAETLVLYWQTKKAGRFTVPRSTKSPDHRVDMSLEDHNELPIWEGAICHGK